LILRPLDTYPEINKLALIVFKQGLVFANLIGGDAFDTAIGCEYTCRFANVPFRGMQSEAAIRQKGYAYKLCDLRATAFPTLDEGTSLGSDAVGGFWVPDSIGA